MNVKPPLILVAEDDKSVRLVVQQALARQGLCCAIKWYCGRFVEID